MKWYPWLRPAYEKLVESYQAGRGHHALLIQAYLAWATRRCAMR